MAFVPASSIFSGVVSGSVSVSNFPASQAVTVASLPLPDGAATENTLAAAAESLDDVGLTAILQRDKMATDD